MAEFHGSVSDISDDTLWFRMREKKKNNLHWLAEEWEVLKEKLQPEFVAGAEEGRYLICRVIYPAEMSFEWVKFPPWTPEDTARVREEARKFFEGIDLERGWEEIPDGE